MEAIDRAVLAAIAGDVLSPTLVDEVIAAARTMVAESAVPDHTAALRRALAAVDREQARCTEAIATGAGAIPALVARLRATEAKRRTVTAELEAVALTTPIPGWREIERRMRASLTDWRSVLMGDVAQARQAFRELLATKIRFTPCVDRGRRAIRFDGQIGLAALFSGQVMNGTSPTRFEPEFGP